MMIINNKLSAAVLLGIAFSFLSACHAGKNDPGRVYTPDMVYSQAYEIYVPISEELRPDGKAATLPPEGTVPHSFSGGQLAGYNLPYPYENSNEGYEMAGEELNIPVRVTEDVLAEGKRLYNINCAICHGEKGNGKGYIVESGKYTAAPPSYFSEGYIDMPEGKMFHSIHYGKGAMGSYAYALSKEERWMVVSYIKSLQEEYLASQQEAGTDETADEEG